MVAGLIVDQKVHDTVAGARFQVIVLFLPTTDRSETSISYENREKLACSDSASEPAHQNLQIMMAKDPFKGRNPGNHGGTGSLISAGTFTGTQEIMMAKGLFRARTSTAQDLNHDGTKSVSSKNSIPHSAQKLKGEKHIPCGD